MKVYTVHLRREGLDPDRDLVVVKEGFCWPAFLFTGLWALWHRLWLAAITIIALSAACSMIAKWLGADSLVQGTLGLAVSVLIGFAANDLRRRRLERQGFVDAALLHFVRGHPEIARAA